MSEHTLVFTEKALSTIENMRIHVNNIGLCHGKDSSYYREAVESLINVLTRMTNLGGRVYADSGLDLYCVTDSIEYGVNFHSASSTWSINS